MEIEFVLVQTPGDVGKLCEIARTVWHETYDSIIGFDQAEYMIEKFQSPKAVKEQREKLNYRYYLIVCDGENAGFLGVSPRYEGREELFLSKIYLLPQFRGHGAVSKAFALAEREAIAEKLPSIWLTVNKNNTHAIEVYRHLGFAIEDEVVSDIGHGYVMDDYILRKHLVVCENNC